ncbi:hypothetical protein HAX54_042913, partial [Datura stramonium]|nr:hypothetical protein [Datura stramonium]
YEAGFNEQDRHDSMIMTTGHELLKGYVVRTMKGGNNMPYYQDSSSGSQSRGRGFYGRGFPQHFQPIRLVQEVLKIIVGGCSGQEWLAWFPKCSGMFWKDFLVLEFLESKWLTSINMLSKWSRMRIPSTPLAPEHGF